MVFLVLVFLLGGLWRTEAMAVTGSLGSEVTIICSHSWASTNVKYFCKGTCLKDDILISSSKKNDQNGKYRIADEGNTFTVTISHLTEDDSGTYWCGIERTGWDTYNRLVLTVTNGDQQSNSNTSHMLVYIGTGLVLVVLALSVILFIFFRHRNRDIHASPGMTHAAVNAAAQKRDEDHLTSSSPTANEVQPADLLYTTVSFSSHSDKGTDTVGAEEHMYSSVKFKASDGSR